MTYLTNKLKITEKFSSYWPFLFVFIAVLFNLTLLFPETSIRMDLNDNVFAYALIKRMDLTLGEIIKSGNLLNLPLLIDHWIPEWAMGFPVFNFYQHIPHLTVVLLYRVLSFVFPGLEMMAIFNWVKYLMLSFLPMVFYFSAKKLDFSNLAAGVTALVSTLVSTQYLYGTDYNALVFRGSGMYTQLWGIFFLPLALSFSYQFISYRRHFFSAVAFVCLALSGHLIFGYIAVLSTPLIVISLLASHLLFESADGNYLKNFSKYLLIYTKRLFLLLATCFLLLSYWFIPLMLNQDFQNKSLWDDYTKFNSYGIQQVVKWLLNGQIFDNGRIPILTILIAMGFFYSLHKFFSKQEPISNPPDRTYLTNRTNSFPPASFLLLPLLFLFWLVLYFGRYTFGSFFILPLSDGLHGHRLINGVHLAGILLAGLCGEWIYRLIFNFPYFAQASQSEQFSIFNFKIVSRWKLKIKSLIGNWKLEIRNLLVVLVFIAGIVILLFPALKERAEYLSYNTELINFNSALFTQEEKDFNQVIKKLKELNAHRIYIGRPGNWGRNFNVGSISAFFVAGVNNINTIGFEPESWSPNTDIEQFFSEYDPNYYNLFNVSYVVAPPEEKFGTDAPFMKKIAQYGKFIIYQVEINKGNLAKPDLAPPGNFDFINSDTLIYLTKKDRFNLDRFWIGSPLMPIKNHPTVTFDKNYKSQDYQNFLTMNGLNYYQLAKPGKPDGYYNLFGANPFEPKNNLLNFNLATPSGTILSEDFSSNLYRAMVETPQESLLMLKVTHHPFWKATVDGKSAEIKTVMPFFMAIKIPEGKHEVKFEYYPAPYKNVLLVISLLSIPTLFLIRRRFPRLLN